MIQEIQTTELIRKLNGVIQHLKATFVGKDEIIDLMGVCLIARENLFLLGPPGTAKSAMVKELAKKVQGKYFEYLLTRFTEPNELFGPFDIRKLREGDLVTNTEGMLPEASLVFLDELLNANSAILNSLLMVLNEKVFRRGKETKALPVLMIIGASNHLPEDEALQALFDRFLVRVNCTNVPMDHLKEVLNAGWKLEQNKQTSEKFISTEEIALIQKLTSEINLENIRNQYIELIQKLRNAGISVSDRRAVKLQRLIAASAVICGRNEAIISDLWVIRYIWDTEEQQEIIASIVNSTVSSDPVKDSQHPRAGESGLPDPEEIYAEVSRLATQWDHPETTSADRSIIKDKLRFLNNRSEWIKDETRRKWVQKPIDDLWRKILGAEE